MDSDGLVGRERGMEAVDYRAEITSGGLEREACRKLQHDRSKL
jgi:hypothetical protein